MIKRGTRGTAVTNAVKVVRTVTHTFWIKGMEETPIKIETVLAGGENYLGSRPLHYEWVKKCMTSVWRIMSSSFSVRPGMSLLRTGKNIVFTAGQHRWSRL